VNFKLHIAAIIVCSIRSVNQKASIEICHPRFTYFQLQHMQKKTGLKSCDIWDIM
jgi:hypothetical protein